MAGKAFNFMDLLNAQTKAEGVEETKDYEEIYLSPYEVKDAQENTHQKLEGIEELADNFLTVGQEQPTVLARVNGEFRIIDGHRRNAANIFNLERGYKEYKKIKYRYKDMSEAMYELRLLAGNGYTQELTAYEKVRLVERTKAALIRAKEEDGLEIQGKMRDLIAAMVQESGTNVARMENINNNATQAVKEQLKEGNLGLTAAYEAAKLEPEEQDDIAERAAAGENVRAKDIAEKVAAKKAGDDYRTPHPESITSICYSCLNYSTCNVKTGTCQKCDEYVNKAEAEKTDEVVEFIASHVPEITAIIAGFVAAFAVVKIAGILTSIVGAISAVITAVQAGIPVMTALNAVLAVNPVILIVAAIAALVVAFITLWNTSDSFRQFWLDLWETVWRYV